MSLGLHDMPYNYHLSSMEVLILVDQGIHSKRKFDTTDEEEAEVSEKELQEETEGW